ncbi:unnamed protein product [Echinostoma caproni]|uniref:Spectrin repeat-containing domain protein n=1 Tax=Echinostoma caproni TaxID=27848 RepID=A0A183AKV8_9TREM|nr:unnamed protein product [Echinostoma caproni]
MVREQRAGDLSDCEQLVDQLEKAQTKYVDWFTQLSQVQQGLANVSNMLENPQSDLWGVSLDISKDRGGLDDQIRQLAALEQDLIDRLQPGLQQLCDEVHQVGANIHGLETTQAELNDLVEVVRHKLHCLHLIRGHLKDLVERSRYELDELQKVTAKLTEFTFHVTKADTPWTESDVEQDVLGVLHRFAQDLSHRETLVTHLLDELDQVVGAKAVGPGFDRLDRRQGRSRNGKQIEQLDNELRTTWKYVSGELLVNAGETSIKTAISWHKNTIGFAQECAYLDLLVHVSEPLEGIYCIYFEDVKRTKSGIMSICEELDLH